MARLLWQPVMILLDEAVVPVDLVPECLKVNWFRYFHNSACIQRMPMYIPGVHGIYMSHIVPTVVTGCICCASGDGESVGPMGCVWNLEGTVALQVTNAPHWPHSFHISIGAADAVGLLIWHIASYGKAASSSYVHWHPVYAKRCWESTSCLSLSDKCPLRSFYGLASCMGADWQGITCAQADRHWLRGISCKDRRTQL